MGKGMERKLVTIREVAAALSCSRTTIWRRVKDGQLPTPLSVCGMTRWRPEDIDAFIDRAAVPAPVVAPAPRKRIRPNEARAS